eukprot:10831265-Lingulodinium_polyedra.AAC.1
MALMSELAVALMMALAMVLASAMPTMPTTPTAIMMFVTVFAMWRKLCCNIEDVEEVEDAEG